MPQWNRKIISFLCYARLSALALRNKGKSCRVYNNGKRTESHVYTIIARNNNLLFGLHQGLGLRFFHRNLSNPITSTGKYISEQEMLNSVDEVRWPL